MFINTTFEINHSDLYREKKLNLLYLSSQTNYGKSRGGCYPHNAVNVEDVYVIRSKHSGELLPGKLVPEHGRCYCPYDGKELQSNDYEVLCDSSVPGTVKGYGWEEASGGHIPKNAIVAGIAKDGSPLYVVKGYVNGELCIGKLHDGHPCAYLPWGGKENRVDEYDVLVWRKH
ncbi:unnamed protein product [Trichobilharzia szidati]|nr:unnamed protein product [Trichobilharzia szidati]